MLIQEPFLNCRTTYPPELPFTRIISIRFVVFGTPPNVMHALILIFWEPPLKLQVL
jgi:hypothetical protein